MLERRRGKQNSAPFYEHLHRRVDNEMQSRARAMMATETPTHIDVAPFPRDTTIQTPMAHPQHHIQQSTTTTLYIPSPSQTTSTANDLTPSATMAQEQLNVPAATTSRSKGKQRATKPRRGRANSPWGGSTLSIVDLAGSERARDAKTQGATLAEAGKINESLMYLGQCLQMQSDAGNMSKVGS